MPLIDQLSRLRSNILSEEEEFAKHIRMWFPISLVIGVIVGLAMTLFLIFTSLIAFVLGGVLPILAVTIGGVLIWLMFKVGFEDPSSNGISYVIKKRHAREPVPLSQTQEFVSAGVAIGSGLPVGREGPALIIGSALASSISRWGNIPDEDLHEAITIGSAAATGALFQAPFGSAVFAAEVPYKEDSDEPMLMVAILASVVAAITLRTAILIFNSTFQLEIDLHLFRLGVATLEINILNSILAFSLGLLIGFGGRGIIDIYYRYQTFLRSKFNVDNRIAIGLIISLMSLLIGIITIENFYLAEGVSTFDGIQNFLDPNQPNIIIILFGLLVIQIIATIAIIAVGFPGGVFSPSLSIGAISGIIFAMLLNITYTPTIIAFAIVGMSSSHAAFTKTPIASILLVLEVTNLPNLIIPIILANISAYLVSGHRSLYEGQIRSRDANLLKQLADYDQFEEFRIKQIMTPRDKLITATKDLTLEEMRITAMKRAKRTFPVIDSEDTLIGIITFNDIINGINKGMELVEDVMTTEVVSVNVTSNVRQGLVKILQGDVERAPVVNNENKVVGIVTQHDILLGHQRLIESFEETAKKLDRM